MLAHNPFRGASRGDNCPLHLEKKGCAQAQMTVHGSLPIETNLREAKGSHEVNVGHHAKQGSPPLESPSFTKGSQDRN
jgi:hypothetical protein